MHVLTNGKVEISFDEQANPVSLRNLATGREWCSGNCGSLWRIIFEQGIVQEAEALPDRSRIEVEPGGRNAAHPLRRSGGRKRNARLPRRSRHPPRRRTGLLRRQAREPDGERRAARIPVSADRRPRTAPGDRARHRPGLRRLPLSGHPRPARRLPHRLYGTGQQSGRIRLSLPRPDRRELLPAGRSARHARFHEFRPDLPEYAAPSAQMRRRRRRGSREISVPASRRKRRGRRIPPLSRLRRLAPRRRSLPRLVRRLDRLSRKSPNPSAA